MYGVWLMILGFVLVGPPVVGAIEAPAALERALDEAGPAGWVVWVGEFDAPVVERSLARWTSSSGAPQPYRLWLTSGAAEEGEVVTAPGGARLLRRYFDGRSPALLPHVFDLVVARAADVQPHRLRLPKALLAALRPGGLLLLWHEPAWAPHQRRPPTATEAARMLRVARATDVTVHNLPTGGFIALGRRPGPVGLDGEALAELACLRPFDLVLDGRDDASDPILPGARPVRKIRAALELAAAQPPQAVILVLGDDLTSARGLAKDLVKRGALHVYYAYGAGLHGPQCPSPTPGATE